MHQLRVFLRSEPSICRFLSEMVAEFGFFLGGWVATGQELVDFLTKQGIANEPTNGRHLRARLVGRLVGCRLRGGRAVLPNPPTWGRVTHVALCKSWADGQSCHCSTFCRPRCCFADGSYHAYHAAFGCCQDLPFWVGSTPH